MSLLGSPIPQSYQYSRGAARRTANGGLPREVLTSAFSRACDMELLKIQLQGVSALPTRVSHIVCGVRTLLINMLGTRCPMRHLHVSCTHVNRRRDWKAKENRY